jgi:phospholipid/cholesterol/gamma-HCH transport system ATP-binding protein
VSVPRPSLLLDVRGLRKRYGNHEVLTGVGLEVQRARVVAVLGRSGAGKSVLLKCLAGIERPDAGVIVFDGATLDAGEPAALTAFRRRCSVLFQNNALLDSLTAIENVGLPLEQTTDLGSNAIHQRSLEALRQFELDSFADRYPNELSGGMQKRLALARAIVTRPDLVLFDEPTAGLDPVRRNSVFAMMVRYQRQFGFTAVIVTHDVREALVISDHVALLDSGTMRFAGSPTEFHASTDSVVCDFRDSADALGRAVNELRALQPPQRP